MCWSWLKSEQIGLNNFWSTDVHSSVLKFEGINFFQHFPFHLFPQSFFLFFACSYSLLPAANICILVSLDWKDFLKSKIYYFTLWGLVLKCALCTCICGFSRVFEHNQCCGLVLLTYFASVGDRCAHSYNVLILWPAAACLLCYYWFC